MKRLLLLSLLLTFASACGSDSEAPADTADASTVEDASGTLDMAPQDAGGETDMTVATDMAADLTHDMGEESDASDMTSMADMGADTGADDAGSDDAGTSDAGSEGACANGFTETVGIAGQVSACAAGTESLNQCDASNACATGWHLCTASEHRAVYETTEAPAVLDSTLWIAGCVRDGGAPMSPMDNVCSDCTGTQTGSDEDVGFSCVNSIRLTSESLYVGIRAAGSCQFAGTSDSGNDAYWSPQPSSNDLNGALCCAD